MKNLAPRINSKHKLFLQDKKVLLIKKWNFIVQEAKSTHFIQFIDYLVRRSTSNMVNRQSIFI